MDGTPEVGEPVSLLDQEGHSLGIGDLDLETEGPIAVRRLGLPNEQAEGVIPRQLRRALERRALVVDDPRYCRIVNDEGDGLPGLVVDRFGDHFAVQTTTRAMDARIEELTRSLAEVAGARTIMLRNDTQRRRRAGLEPERARVLYGAPPRWTRILELSARITIDLHQGPETGYSYALREVRKAVGRLAQNARVLDPSCSVAGTVIQAGLHGARSISAFAEGFECCDLATENIEANGLMTRAKIDCGNALEALRDNRDTFDLVLLHAPVRGNDPERWVRDFDELILLSLRATRHGGRMVVAAPDTALGADPLEEHVLRACDRESRAAYRLLRPAAPSDFPAVAGAPDALASVVLEIS